MAKKKTATPREGQRVRTRIKHTFTEQEKDDKVKEMTRTMREVELKQEQLKSANATAKAEIRMLLAVVTDLRNQLDDGGEPREVDALLVMDRTIGIKTFYRFCPDQANHLEKLRVENMTEDDYQSLGLEVTEPAKPAEKPDDDPPHPEE